MDQPTSEALDLFTEASSVDQLGESSSEPLWIAVQLMSRGCRDAAEVELGWEDVGVNDAEFWALIDASVEPGGLADLDALGRDLATAGPSAVREFGVLLSRRVDELGSDVHLSGLAAVDEFVAAGAGQDHFEYVRTAVVAAGSAAYAVVLRDPATIGEFNHLAEPGMDLLELPRAVFEQISDLPYDDDDPGVEDYVPMPVDLNVVWSTVPPDMPMWRRAVGAYAEHIWDDAAAWRAWLKPSGRDEVEIMMEIASDPDDGPQPGQRVRAGQNRCTATMTRVNEPALTAGQQIDAAGKTFARSWRW